MRARLLGLSIACLSVVACTAEPPRERVSKTSSAIIEGHESGADQDAVVLLYQAGRNQTCTGTMLAPNLLVTARHCVGAAGADGLVVDGQASDVRVFVGRDALTTLHEDEDHPATRGKELVVPAARSFYPDVAFVVLEDPLATPVAAVRLDGGVAIGESLGVIGYGLDENGTRPKERMQKSGLVVYLVGPARSHIGERLARGELAFGEAACSGDSGGPAFSERTGALVAVASRVGNGTAPNAADPAGFCVGDETDDVYTDLSPVADLARHAFEIAGASAVLEDSVAPAKSGDLASAHVSADGAPQASSDGAGDGCAFAPATRHASSMFCVFGLAAGITSARRCRSRRGRSRSARP